MQGLPKDVFRYLLRPLLSPRSLVRLRSTNRWFYELYRNDTSIERWSEMAEDDSPNYCLQQAALLGHWDLVNVFIFKGADDWIWGLCGASLGGHRDLVDFFISKII